MSNVFEFKPRKASAVSSEPAKRVASVEVAQTQHKPQSKDEAALTIVSALSFYAQQGFDHGERARQALHTMKAASEIEAPQDERA
ncbi:hypothetical protein QN372_00110 [Undibacterium sp. RTI2.1]|uniref:hypothetical protein n=1 Tax=unclassified Undibacterium TaxID=2630295 RepID=UPI002B22AEF8|nr:MULTISPECIES: hypothetical protein [unclassified Undibacterium]MEB0029141.1 hypothetical protein [Undibacterium sp. RTI2.1]MEB0115449.1 hypothetical protein [Undibacterium sp. RTI2.2]